jgi:hypothetical protein
MATTMNPATNGHAELKLAAKDPEVAQSGSGDRFTVTFTMEGVDLLELENVLRPRLAAVGVERISRFGMTISLYGVEEGRESEVFHQLETAIEDVNRLRQTAREDRERRRSATEDAEAAAESRLDTVREGFHAARESGSPNARSEPRAGGGSLKPLSEHPRGLTHLPGC